MELTQGVLIAIEGIDGSGKSTQVHLLDEYLTQNNIPHVVSRWGMSGVGKELRSFILDRETPLDARTCAYLYAAALDLVIREEIVPALKENKVVLCDRLLLSMFIYQGILGNQYLFVNSLINELLKLIEDIPYYNLVLDVSPDVARNRIEQSRPELDVMERVPLETYAKRQNLFISTAWYHKIVIPACDTIGEVQLNLQKEVKSILDCRIKQS